MKPKSSLRRLLLAAGSSLLAISSASAQSWDGSSSGAWLDGTNWTGDVAAGSTTSTDTDIAVFNVNANNTIGINMGISGANGNYYLGAIDNTNATARIIENTSGTSGILTLNGATVNSVANTILRNSQTQLLTFRNNTTSGTLGLALGNATTNVIQITNTGGITINSIISGSGGITTQGGGSGVLTLAGNNTYTGVTAISNSSVTVTNANGLGSNTDGNHTSITYTGGLNGTGGRLFLSGGITVPENITITGNNNTGGAGFNVAIGSSSGTNTFSGTITLTGTAGGNTIRIGEGTTIFSGTITQSGMATSLGLQGTTTVNNAMTLNGNGVIVIGASSVVTLNGVSGSGIGSTGIAQGGTLVLGVTNALNTSANLTVGSFGATDTGTFSLNGYNQTVNALNSNSATTQTGSRIVRNNHATTASILTVGNGGGTGAFNGTIVNGAAATLALVKTGAGTQTLSGANTYTGSTTVNGGTLSIASTGSLSVSTALVVGGGTFSYSGGAAQTVNGLTVNAGNSVVTNTNTGITNKLNLGAITRSAGAGSVNFSNASATDNVITTSSSTSNGILGAWATVGPDWATKDGSNNILAYTAYTNVDRLTPGTIAAGSTTNVRIVEGSGSTGDIGMAASGITAINTLLQSASGGSGAATVNVGDGNTLRTTGLMVASGAGSLTIGSTAGSGTVTAASAGGELIALNQSSNSMTINSVIANHTSTSSLTKLGTGALTLNATNTYTGATNINAGTLALGHATDTLSNSSAVTVDGATAVLSIGGNSDTVGAVSLKNGASITGSGGTLTGASYAVESGSVSAILGGDGIALTKSTAGTVTLSGINTYTGATNINAGTLQLDGSTHASSTVAIATAGTLTGTGTVNGNATLTGSGIINKASGPIAGTLGVTGGNWNGNGAVTGLVTSSSGTFTIGSGANLTANGNLNVTGGSIAAGSSTSTITGSVDYSSATNSTFAGVIAGSDKTLTKSGASTLTLTGTNTYTGGTRIDEGILTLAHGTNTLADTGAVNVNGGTLALGTNTDSVGAVTLTSGSITGSGAGTLTGTSYDVRSGSVTAILAGSGVALTKSTSGTVTLSGVNTFTGVTTLTSGTLSAATIGNGGVAGNLGQATSAAGNLVFDGGTLQYTGSSATSDRAFTINAGKTATIETANNLSFVGATGTATTGALTKTGAGTLTLTGESTYTGLTTVTTGALNVTGTLASTSALSVGASGTAVFATVGQSLGAVTNANTAANALDFNASTGTVVLASLTGIGNTRFGSNGTVTGGISTGTVNAVGLLTSAISGGTVGAGSLSSTSVTGGTNNITGAAGITTIDGGNTTVGGVATIGTMTSGTANLNGATSSISTLNGGTVNLSSSTIISVSEGSTAGSIAGTDGSLAKTGIGTLTLSGANTYTGATNVNAGTLIVNGSLASTSVVVDGALGGSGSMVGATLSGTGSINPGNSPGIMTAAAADPTGGLDYNFELTGAANSLPVWNNAAASVNDVLRLTDATNPFTASLNNTNTITIYLGVTTLTLGDAFTGGFFTDKNADFLASVQNATFQYFLSDPLGMTTYLGNNYTLYSGPLDFLVSTVQIGSADFDGGTVTNGYVTQFTVIPEPSTALLGGLGLLALLRRRR